MNGPEHYAEAERLLESGDWGRAQAHATLALVAATVHTVTPDTTVGPTWEVTR